MALTLRHSWENGRARNDWTVYDDLLERPVGRVYEISAPSAEAEWFWVIHTGDAYGSGAGTSGRASTLEKAKAAVLINWMAIKGWSQE